MLIICLKGLSCAFGPFDVATNDTGKRVDKKVMIANVSLSVLSISHKRCDYNLLASAPLNLDTWI